MVYNHDRGAALKEKGKTGMPVVLSLQGCMAVGKTTAVEYLRVHAPYVHISYESVADVVEAVKARALKKDVFADYVEIQRLWITHEIERYRRAQAFECTVMDFGAEEIEFYTLHYPLTIGQRWPVEETLHEELAALRSCMPDRILFLRAREETLRARKEGDTTRTRTFFEHHLQYLLPLKTKWFIGRPDVDVLDVDALTQEETGARVKAWVDAQIASISGFSTSK